jgi:hypothetical protein
MLRCNLKLCPNATAALAVLAAQFLWRMLEAGHKRRPSFGALFRVGRVLRFKLGFRK